jgi:putative peptidoglycan lipid II flippase
MSRAGWFIRTTAMIVVVTMVSRVLGFLRSVFITDKFGLSMETDAYFFALNIPNTLFLVIPGAISAVLIPTLKGFTGEAQLAARDRLFHQATTWTAFGCLALTAAGMIWAPEVIRVLAPDFSPDKQLLTADMLRIMMPSVFFTGLIAILSAVLNAHEDFFATSVGPVLNNLIVIASIFLLTPWLGVEGIAWGTSAGFGVFALYLLLPTLRRFKYSLRVNFRLRGERTLIGMGERFVPVMFGTAVSQVYLFLEKILAGGLGDAKISALSLGFTLVQLPIAVFFGALAVPLFPLLSDRVKQGRMDEMKAVLAKGFLYPYHVLLPTTVGLILLAEPFVRAFFAHGGEFDGEDARLTAWAVIFYAAGMVGWAGRDLLIRASYAIENTRTPVAIGIVSTAVSLGLALLLMPALDHGGLALAYSLGTYFNMLLQAWFLRRQIGRLFERAFYLSLAKGLAGAAGMAAVILGLLTLLGPAGALGIPGLAITVAAAAGSYLLLLLLLKEPAAGEILAKLTARRKKGGGSA